MGCHRNSLATRELWRTDHGLRATGYGLQVADCGCVTERDEQLQKLDLLLGTDLAQAGLMPKDFNLVYVF